MKCIVKQNFMRYYVFFIIIIFLLFFIIKVAMFDYLR